jgi:hypothetical protein
MANAPPPWVECPTCSLRYRDRGEGCPRCADKAQGPVGSPDLGDARVTQWSSAPPAAPPKRGGLGGVGVVVVLAIIGSCVKAISARPSGGAGGAPPVAASAGGTEPIPVEGKDQLNANALRLGREEFMATCQRTWKDPFECGCLTATVYDELGSDIRNRLLEHKLTAAEQGQVNKIASRNCGHPTQVTIIPVSP